MENYKMEMERYTLRLANAKEIWNIPKDDPNVTPDERDGAKKDYMDLLKDPRKSAANSTTSLDIREPVLPYPKNPTDRINNRFEMRFAAAFVQTSTPPRRRPHELFEYAELMFAKGKEEEETKHDLESALKYYKLAQRTQRSWLEAVSGTSFPEPEDDIVATTQARLEAALQDTAAEARPDWEVKHEKRFFRDYSVPPAKERKTSGGKQPWRVPSRRPTIPEPAVRPRRRTTKRKVLKEVNEPRAVMLDEIVQAATPQVSGDMQALLEAKELQISMLTRQLQAAGCAAISEVVPLDEAKERLAKAVKVVMGEVEGSATEAEAEIEKWDTFINNHPDQLEAVENARLQWINDNQANCLEALTLSLSFVPEDVFLGTSQSQLAARGLPASLAARVYATPALWLLRATPDFVARVHDVDLRGKFDFQNLDLVELMALWARLKDVVFDNDPQKRKAAWKDALFDRLKRMVDNTNLPPRQKRHPVYKDVPDGGPFDPAAPLVAPPTANSVADTASSDTASLGDQFDGGTDTPPPGGLVSQAKAQLRRSSSMKLDDLATPTPLSATQRAIVEKRRSAVSPPGSSSNLLAELKTSLRKRRGASDDDDIGDNQRTPGAASSEAATGAASPPRTLLLEELAGTPHPSVESCPRRQLFQPATPPKAPPSSSTARTVPPPALNFAAELQQRAAARAARQSVS